MQSYKFGITKLLPPLNRTPPLTITDPIAAFTGLLWNNMRKRTRIRRIVADSSKLPRKLGFRNFSFPPFLHSERCKIYCTLILCWGTLRFCRRHPSLWIAGRPSSCRWIECTRCYWVDADARSTKCGFTQNPMSSPFHVIPLNAGKRNTTSSSMHRHRNSLLP